MTIISKPRECINAGCTAMCSPILYEDNQRIFKDDVRKCPNFKTELMIPLSMLDDIKLEMCRKKHRGSRLTGKR